MDFEKVKREQCKKRNNHSNVLLLTRNHGNLIRKRFNRFNNLNPQLYLTHYTDFKSVLTLFLLLKTVKYFKAHGKQSDKKYLITKFIFELFLNHNVANVIKY